MKKRLVSGTACGIVVNSGCANATAGKKQYHDAMTMAQLAATHLGLNPECMLVASTGVIVHHLPRDRITDGYPASNAGGTAVMTSPALS